MNKIVWAFVLVLALLVVAAVPTFADAPFFGEAIYADGQAWGTKVLKQLPPPNGHNNQSFDGLYTFGDDAADGQLPVAEAAPGNRNYNGGRWDVQVVTWNVASVLVTSYDQLMTLEAAGDVTISSADTYFLCPLLPAKS